MQPPTIVEGQAVLDGPTKVRGEYRWQVRLPDGRRGVIGQQLAELADDDSLRRRYVYESERRAALHIDGLVEQWAMGPLPDPRDSSAAAPWRLRADPDGESLDQWLKRRAPVAVEEAIELGAKLADVIHQAHNAGLVIRDLEPRNIVLDSDGKVWLTDIGFARVDILSTRTASSLMLESSPYAAPEHLRATTIDHRADIYTLGTMIWEALTGALPFASGPALFRSSAELADLGAICPALSPSVRDLIHACLDDNPARRPDSARDVMECLRGRAFHTETALAQVTCQACHQPLRPGLRLCLGCGKQAVQFVHAPPDEKHPYEVLLTKATEDVKFLTRLRGFFELLGEGPPPALNFIVGDIRMYSKAERTRRLKLPVTLFTNLTKTAAEDLAARLKADGFKVKIRRADHFKRQRRINGRIGLVGLAASIAGVALLSTSAMPLGVFLLIGGIPTAVVGAITGIRKAKPQPPALAGLRKQPAALPASDPLVARIATLLQSKPAPDVRAQLSELALWVQRLCDRRGRLGEASELATLTEPVAPLVSLVERQVASIATCDTALAELDEGVLIRAIARSEAQGKPQSHREELLTGLDKLRTLEDQRAQHMRHLLEASSLARRTVELGLAATTDADRDDQLYRLALAELESQL